MPVTVSAIDYLLHNFEHGWSGPRRQDLTNTGCLNLCLVLAFRDDHPLAEAAFVAYAYELIIRKQTAELSPKDHFWFDYTWWAASTGHSYAVYRILRDGLPSLGGRYGSALAALKGLAYALDRLLPCQRYAVLSLAIRYDSEDREDARLAAAEAKMTQR